MTSTSFNQLEPSTKKKATISVLALVLLTLFCASVALVAVFGGARLTPDKRWGEEDNASSEIGSGGRREDGIIIVVLGAGPSGSDSIISNRDLDETTAPAVPSPNPPSPFFVDSTTSALFTSSSPIAKSHLRSMLATSTTFPPFTSTSTSSSTSPLPTANRPSLSPSNIAFSDSPTAIEAFGDLHPVGTSQPSDLPFILPSSVQPTTLSPTTVVIGGGQFEFTSVPSAASSSQVDDLASTPPLSESPSEQPTITPLFPIHNDPVNASKTFFNYNTTEGSRFGPSSWGNVIVTNSTFQNYWSEFGFVANQCNHEKVAQSPIDVCTSPEKYCLEHHEPRAKGGNFKLTDHFIAKQILPNKLHLRITRKVDNQTIPPSFDFASTGAKSLDLLNIDIKLPAEHTVCGRRFDGEMQYYFLHPVKLNLIAVAWLLEVQDVDNPMNEHMQRLIDEFQKIYDVHEGICRRKSVYESSVMESINHTMMPDGHRELPVLNSYWDPFHRDIQKTIHFWGYNGSLTEPPCAGKTMWRIMDVPVPISMDQLNQMKNILFNNRDSGTCAFTSTQYKGSVARPINDPVPYYKCTRDDYKSDDERDLCGDGGCFFPFSTHLDRYVEPIVQVTAPPSMAPSMSPMDDGQI